MDSILDNLICFENSQVVSHFDGVVDFGLYPFEKRFFDICGINIERSRVLNLGCGAGREAIYLALKGASVFAVDISAKMLDKAKDNAKKVNAKIEFIKSDCFDLEFPPKSFDVVFGTHNFISHIPVRKYRLSLLSKIRELLVPGGFCILSYHDRNLSPEFQEFWEKRQQDFGIGFDKDEEFGNLSISPLDSVKYDGPQLCFHFWSQEEFDYEASEANMNIVLRKSITELSEPGVIIPWAESVIFVALQGNTKI